MASSARFDYNPFKLDVAKAKALLAEAGYPNGFEIKLDAPNISPFTEIAQSMQQTMGAGGVKVNIVPADAKQVLGIYRARKHQMLLISWDAGLPRSAHQRRRLRAQRRQLRQAGNQAAGVAQPWYIPEITQGDGGGREGAGHRQAQVELYEDLQQAR